MEKGAVTTCFVLTQFAAFFRLLWIGFPFPWFKAALLMWVVQAANVQYLPNAMDRQYWLHAVWMPMEGAAILVTFAACIEAISRVERFCPSPSFKKCLTMASAGLSGALAGMGVLFIAPAVGNALEVFRTLRGWVWVLLAVSMAVVALLMGLNQVWTPGYVRLHFLLLMACLVAHATTCWWAGGATEETRALVRTIYHGVVILACCGWCVMPKEA